MKKLLLILLAATVAFLPQAASADVLSYYTGDTPDQLEALAPRAASVVRFDLTPADLYTLDSVRLFLSDGDSVYGNSLFILHVWNKDLVRVLSLPVVIDYQGPNWYSVDLTTAGLPQFDASFRVGLAQTADPAMVYLGADLDSNGNSYSYDFLGAPGTEWTLYTEHNLMMEANVTLVPSVVAPALSCEGFFPPVHGGTLRIRKGARTVPLKARLYDESGAPVGDDDLAAAPILKVFYTADPALPPVEVTDAAVAAGHSNLGAAFRYTDWDLWKYNLKTKRFALPGTYTVRLASGDEAEYRVDPDCSADIVVTGPKPKHMSKWFGGLGR